MMCSDTTKKYKDFLLSLAEQISEQDMRDFQFSAEKFKTLEQDKGLFWFPLADLISEHVQDFQFSAEELKTLVQDSSLGHQPMAPAAPQPVASTKETTNYARLSRLLVDKGSQALRDTFNSIHPPEGLNLVLASNPAHKTLQSLRKKKILNPTQWGKLYPATPSSVSSASFDTTLLIVLLRNICGLHAPISGWDSLPPLSDTSKEANIARVKYYRNTVYGHASEASVDDETFNTYWQDISNALIALGGASYGAAINKLKNECMDPDLEEHYRELLKQWKKGEDSIKDKQEEIEAQLVKHVLCLKQEIPEPQENVKNRKLSSSCECKLKLISGVYGSDPQNNGDQVFKIEHCALQVRGNKWNLELKCRPRGYKDSKTRWIDVWDYYPDATVKIQHNYIGLTIPSPKEYHEVALFGIPEITDKKRMQIGIFGGKATNGKDWTIFVTLFDDTMMAFKHLCDREESNGRRLLTTPAALFVANSDEDIKIDMGPLDKGWQIKGSKVKTIKAKDAWNSPENSTDFPSCVFEIAHVDETKKLFFCGIKASHSNDSANSEVVVFFEQKNEVILTDHNIMPSQELAIPEDKMTEVFVFIQMLVFLVGCFTGAGFDPFPQSEDKKGIMFY
ncbi:uncharacterized protein LOC144656467 isoform X2 [Oculina patagonica]